MKDLKEVPSSVVGRLPRYYRFLCDLENQGISRISSKTLAEIMCLTASQIRQDFNCFGDFGQQGYGYNVSQLKGQLSLILGLDNIKTAILIGAGNLGRAVASQLSFEDKGFRLIGIFDCDPLYNGIKIRNLPILSDASLAGFCEENKPDMAVLCLPADKAPAMVDNLVELGLKSFWNFSHYNIHKKYPDTSVENVHLSDSLMTLSFIMKNSDNR